MIRVDNGEVTINGELIDILAEYSCLTNAMKQVLSETFDSDGFAVLQHAFRMGLMNEEEIKLKTDKTRKAVEVMKLINEAMKNEKKEDI